MNNVINVCIKGVGVLMLCYFIKRIVEWCRGEPKIKTTGSLDLPGKELSARIVTSGAAPELSIEDQRLSIRNSRDLIIDNVSSEQTESLLKELFIQMSNENREVQFEAKNAIQQIVSSLQSVELTKLLIIQITNFLENIGPVSQYLVVEDPQKIQLFVLALVPKVVKNYSLQDSSIQDIVVLDNLVNCLMKAFDNTIDSGETSILSALSEREKCVQSFNISILENQVKLMISILKNTKYNSLHGDAVEVLTSIMKRELESLVEYTWPAQQVVQAHDDRTKKNSA